MHQIGSLISFSATICAGKAVQEALRNRPDPKTLNPLSLYQLGNYWSPIKKNVHLIAWQDSVVDVS